MVALVSLREIHECLGGTKDEQREAFNQLCQSPNWFRFVAKMDEILMYHPKKKPQSQRTRA